MTHGFTAPPKQDFDTYAGLMDQLSGHFVDLRDWTTGECSDASDLNGLYVFAITELAPRIAALFAEKLAVCQNGMADVGDKARLTGTAYAGAEHANTSNLAKIYGQPLPGFPDIGKIPGLEHIGDFNDETVQLKPPDPAGDITAKNIAEQLTLLGLVSDPASSAFGKQYKLKPTLVHIGSGPGNITGQILWLGDSIFKTLFGQSLVQILLYPIVGNYGRLKFLQEAYEQLSDGIYTVTGTMRKGSVKLGGEWEGDAAIGFDSLLFRWSMGSGGLGDAAKVVSHIFRDAYDTLCVLIQIALQLITRFINEALRQLVEAVVGTLGIVAAGGGPEDPVTDVVAAAWDVYKIYKLATVCYQVITEIIEYYPEIQAAVLKIINEIEVVKQAFEAGIDSEVVINSLLKEVEKRGFEFEKNGSWNPAAGAARLALLPTS